MSAIYGVPFTINENPSHVSIFLPYIHGSHGLWMAIDHLASISSTIGPWLIYSSHQFSFMMSMTKNPWHWRWKKNEGQEYQWMYSFNITWSKWLSISSMSAYTCVPLTRWSCGFFLRDYSPHIRQPTELLLSGCIEPHVPAKSSVSSFRGSRARRVQFF